MSNLLLWSVILTTMADVLPSVSGYLDPGSGSFILQLILGALVGLLVALKAYWGKIKAFFSKNVEQAEKKEEV